MVVASSCLAFRALITQARIGKSFRVQNSTSLLYLLIPSSAETWKIVTKKVITRARLRGQDFATGKNFSFNQCHTKSFAFFSRENYFIKAIENFFPVFA